LVAAERCELPGRRNDAEDFLLFTVLAAGKRDSVDEMMPRSLRPRQLQVSVARGAHRDGFILPLLPPNEAAHTAFLAREVPVGSAHLVLGTPLSWVSMANRHEPVGDIALPIHWISIAMGEDAHAVLVGCISGVVVVARLPLFATPSIAVVAVRFRLSRMPR